MEQPIDYKKNRLFIILSGIFLTNAILAEMIGVKIFSGESTLGLQPANLDIMGFVMNFDLTAGALIWPVVFITSDLINEYFGKPGVKRISYLTAVLIAYVFLIVFLSMKLTPSTFWIIGKDNLGNPVNMDIAFNKIFGQSSRIIVGSLTAFLVGQLVDVYIFQKLRKVTGSKYLWLRSTGSTLVSQLVDSFVVLYIAFSGVFSNSQIIAIGITNYIYKFTVAILLTPVIYLGHYLMDNYLGKQNADQIIEEAASKSDSFL